MASTNQVFLCLNQESLHTRPIMFIFSRSEATTEPSCILRTKYNAYLCVKSVREKTDLALILSDFQVGINYVAC